MKMKELKKMDKATNNNRKIRLKVLEHQLSTMTKPNRGTTKSKKVSPRVPLPDKEVPKIKSEIDVLKTRIYEPKTEPPLIESKK